MDDNKLKVLQETGYKIQKVCGLCRHGIFNYSGNFGYCNMQEYSHLKHSAKERNLSISRYGNCTNFKYDQQYDVMLHGFKEFLEGP